MYEVWFACNSKVFKGIWVGIFETTRSDKDAKDLSHLRLYGISRRVKGN